MSGSIITIDPGEFVSSITPLLEARDLEGLLDFLRQRWSAEQVASLLACSDCDARKVAALALSLIGQRCCIPAIAERLKDPDPLTNQLAEHALWSIWFRSGSQAANSQLLKGTQCLSDRRFECAEKHFNRAIDICPDFAEAYNQRGIAAYLQDDYRSCIEDCRTAVRLMPCHFGAWAGMGHCHAHLGELEEALLCYERALKINPHLDCVHQAVCELRRKVAKSA